MLFNSFTVTAKKPRASCNFCVIFHVISQHIRFFTVHIPVLRFKDDQLTLFMFLLKISNKQRTWMFEGLFKSQEQFNQPSELHRRCETSGRNCELVFPFPRKLFRELCAFYFVSHKNWSNFRCDGKSFTMFLSLINLWTLRHSMINFSHSETSLIILKERNVSRAALEKDSLTKHCRRMRKMFVTCLFQPQLIFKWEMILPDFFPETCLPFCQDHRRFIVYRFHKFLCFHCFA